MQGIRCDQSAQNRVSACQRTQDRGFVSATLGLVVGNDDNCPARIASRVLLDVRSGVQQPARNIGAAFESLAIEHAFDFPLGIQAAGANGMRKRVRRSNTMVAIRSWSPSARRA
jgi:hypothetical protein